MIASILATALAQLLIVAPLVWLTLERQKPERFTLVTLFAIYGLVQDLLLRLPLAVT